MFREDAVEEADISRFGEVLQPAEAIEPILARAVRTALLEWLQEIWAEEELQAVGIGPRKRAMFSGKPGTGKTTLAHHLAARLGLPMLVVRPERIISRYVGQTGQQIGRLFDLLATPGNDYVLFIDEFDAIAMERGRPEQASDHNRNAYVNVLLQRIEQYRGFLIAATNYAENIDQAIWRRFDIHVTLDLPGQFERERILERYLAPFGLPPVPLKAFAESFETASPALIRHFCENLKRQIVVGPKIGASMQREAVIDRLIAAVGPHPDMGKPRLWSKGAKDEAIRILPWPLPKACEINAQPPPPAAAGNVVPLAHAVRPEPGHA